MALILILPSQEVQEGEKEKKDEEKKKEVEPNFQLLENPARVMPAQLKVLTMPETCRYQPFKPVTQNPPDVDRDPHFLFFMNLIVQILHDMLQKTNKTNRVKVKAPSVRHSC